MNTSFNVVYLHYVLRWCFLEYNVTRIKFIAVPTHDVVLPPFTSKVVKSIIIRSGLADVLEPYLSSKSRFKPITLTPLYRDGKPLFSTGSGILTISVASRLEFYVTIVNADTSIYDKVSSLKLGIVRVNYGEFLVVLDSIEITSIDSLSIGLRGKDAYFRIDFLTPVLLSSKLMTPPVDRIVRRARRIEPMHILVPRPSYIFNYLVRL